MANEINIIVRLINLVNGTADKIKRSLQNIGLVGTQTQSSLEGLNTRMKALTQWSTELGISAHQLETGLMKQGFAVNSTGKIIDTMTGRYVKQQNALRNSIKMTTRFQMGLLSVMFAAKMVSNAMWGLLQPSMEVYGIFDMLGITLTMFFLPVMDLLASILFGIMDFFMNLPEPVQEFIGVLVVTLAIIAAILVPLASFGLLIGGLAGIFGITAGAILLPILAIIAAVLLIVAVGYLLWKNWDKISAFFIGIWEGIKTAVSNAINAIWKYIEPIWVEIEPRITKALNIIKNIFVSTWNFIKNIISSVWNNVLKPIWDLMIVIIEKIGEKLDKYLRPIWERVVGILKDVWQKLGEGMKWVWDNIIKPPLDAFLKLMELIKDVYDKTLGKIANWFEAVTTAFGGGVKELTAKVEKVQGGGMISQSGLAYVHKGETVIPAGSSIAFSPSVTINATLASPMDIRAIGDELLRVWQHDLRRLQM